MSNDRHDDERVSAVYGKLAREQTPEHLDRKILEMAARSAGKPVYSRWMRWSRPVAWAATITLCLAITLELTREPAVDVSIDANSPASVPLPGQSERDNGARDSDVSNEQGLSNGRSIATDQHLPEARELAKDKVPAKQELSRSIKPADLERQQEVAASMAESAASEKTSLARSASQQLLDEPAAMMSDVAEQDQTACSAEIRAVPSDWLECITALETEGMQDAALAERELLIDTFPDFKLP